MSMTLDEIQAAKAEMEHQVLLVVAEFMRRTAIPVESLQGMHAEATQMQSVRREYLVTGVDARLADVLNSDR